MLGEVENLKKGNFDDNLITSIINNLKKNVILSSETYSSRASDLMDAFTNELDWRNQVAYVDQLSKISKQDIVAFANKYFAENYVVVFKRKGEDKNVTKVEKPAITPVETNSKQQSAFVKAVNEMPSAPVKPVWIDYNKDLQKAMLGPARVLYVQNKENSIFRMRYRVNIGTWNDKKLAVAAQYLSFLGTNKQSTEDITKEFYKIACSFSVNAGAEYTSILIEGLQENFEKAVLLFEDLLANCTADDAALKSLKARLTKTRTDAKANKSAILNGLTSYARYGASNPYNYVLSDEEINNLSAAELVNLLHSLTKYKHEVLYYGPLALPALTVSLKKLHMIPASFTAVPAKKIFTPVQQTSNQVLFADYNMVQAETRWVRNNGLYNPEQEAVVKYV
jgi:hypothetical protein